MDNTQRDDIFQVLLKCEISESLLQPACCFAIASRPEVFAFFLLIINSQRNCFRQPGSLLSGPLPVPDDSAAPVLVEWRLSTWHNAKCGVAKHSKH